MTTATAWSVIERPSALTTRQRLVRDVLRGLRADPPVLPARWFYDETGSRLFEQITMLDEYYPTRREEEILRARATDIVRMTGAGTLVELGAGTSAKTRVLLDAFTAGGRPLRFVPLDVSAETLAAAARGIAQAYPTVHVDAVVADFEDPLAPLPGSPGERLVAFLGGTIGNLDTADRADFLDQVRMALSPGDALLLGADLVKDEARLVAAYDDAAGVTAAFNRNVIDVIARELDAEGLRGDNFDHVARWNATSSRIEMWLRARRDVAARFRAIGFDWRLPGGGELRTEISVKFEPDQVSRELADAGFEVRHLWTDARGDFSVTLAVARPPA